MKHQKIQQTTLDRMNHSDLLDQTLNNEIPAEGLGDHIHEILRLLGEDPAREGLLKTPDRVAKSLSYLTQGYNVDAKAILKSAVFEEDYSEMILVRDIDVFSLCEHHLLPFIGKAHVAYIAQNHIVGLSKIPRVVDAFARRLQVQERLTVQIRDAIDEVLQPLGTAVVIEATHLCMSMRGVEKQNALTATSAMSGTFLSEATTRAEFLQLINAK
ncbi:MAG: GTP cyclohydrolase I FolE [Rhodothermaceae bacterium]|nr:GTP cyclohydrolase I FolE [Rhodothermaceae bacterium]MXW33654.1 GTP cyclohydrolase I FolE [Rhodothermaceae bacterium]MXZ18260.1 GTP cyclohydrolase I FolE [Rhodothermaceae bacterium]MYC03712.1 GTP cyclohydrolase I FolE [Rhodothermaceae bacterium]MYE61722.1 GTP cyclohydrolase I FolE [Rhodothermaceae bacterium]